MPLAVDIRPARPEDLPSIVAIYNHYVEETPATFEVEPVTPGSRRAWFEEHAAGGRHRLLVAEDGTGSVLGWATTSPFRPRAAYATTVESSVYCRAGSIRQGIGRQLYAALFDAIRGEDIERIVAGVTLPNPESLALHRRFGFAPVGVFVRVGRKFGQFWDVEWYQRPLRLEPGPASL
jgi:phosphinothricin acetyltransferase